MELPCTAPIARRQQHRKAYPPPPRAQPSAYMASQEHLVGHYMRREETQPNGVWGLIQQGFDFVPPWG